MSLEANSGEVELSPARLATAKAAIDASLLPEELADLDGFPTHGIVVYRPHGHSHLYLAMRAAALAVRKSRRDGVEAHLVVVELRPVATDLDFGGAW
jgi:hypothetical protein